MLFATAILAWSAFALTFGRLPALFSALLLLVYPAYATLYHQASSDAIFATGLACWALLLARTLERPSGWRFVALGAGIAGLVLIRAANEILLPLALVPLVATVPWRRRVAWSAACLAAAVLPLAAWAVPTAFATTRRRCSAAGGRGCRSCASSPTTARSSRKTATPRGASATSSSRRCSERSRTRGSGSRSTSTSGTGRTTRPSA